jgi:hypothetical protein
VESTPVVLPGMGTDRPPSIIVIAGLLVVGRRGQ